MGTESAEAKRERVRVRLPPQEVVGIYQSAGGRKKLLGVVLIEFPDDFGEEMTLCGVNYQKEQVWR